MRGWWVRRRALVWTLAASALLGGCSYVRVAVGPRLAGVERGADVTRGERALDVADHRDRQRLRFLVVGDAGTGRAEQFAVGEAMHRVCAASGGCDFALVTGDNIYPTGVRVLDAGFDRQFESKFEAPYRLFGRFDFWMVTGNHDWYRRGSAFEEVRYSEASERWRMPALDYAVPRLPAWLAIYGVDSTLIVEGVDSGQLARARQALCEQTGWSVLFSHHGLLTAGSHGDRRGVIPETYEALLPIIEECGVHFHFAGHDHLQAHITAPAFDQVVQGAGGRFLHRIRERDERPPGVEVLEASDDTFGFAIVEAEREKIEVRFYDLESGDAPSYCRRFELAAFSGAERSRACE